MLQYAERNGWLNEDEEIRKERRKVKVMPISGDVYKQIGRSAAGAVSIVAAYDRHDHKIFGLTVSSFATLSFNPPLVMFSIQQNAESYVSMVSSQTFGVSLLSHKQAEVATLFASKGSEKTEKTTFEEGVTLHVPLIPGALGHIECQTSQIFLSGDHAIIIGLVEEAHTYEGQPLLYYDRQFGTFSRLEVGRE